MSIFDPKKFETLTLGQAGSTEYPNVPRDLDIGYIAQCTKYEFRPVSYGDNEGLVFETTWKIDDADGRCAAVGIKNPTIRYGIFLDLRPDGSLDESPEANIKLNRLREAIGKEDTFQFSDVVGAYARIFVDHKQNKNNPEQFTAQVVRIVAA